jgi:MFS family permease
MRPVSKEIFMTTSRRIRGFINIAHAIDHMFMLIFPTAVLGMIDAFGKSYGELLTLSIGGFVAFGAGSIPSGWLGDKWSRRNMLAIFSLVLASRRSQPA